MQKKCFFLHSGNLLEFLVLVPQSEVPPLTFWVCSDVLFHMVPPWIWYSIWKFWVIYVLVFLVFKVFSTAELISLAKTVNLAVWAFSSNFLYDFTLFVIDMHQNMPISLFKTLFDHFHFHPPAGIIWRVILKLRLNNNRLFSKQTNVHQKSSVAA